MRSRVGTHGESLLVISQSSRQRCNARNLPVGARGREYRHDGAGFSGFHRELRLR
jgi:hypothetical protein